MDLALVGTGRMGSAVETVAAERGHSIVARFNSEHPLPEKRSDVGGADVLIDFSLPDLAPTHIERYCQWRIPAVVGTTGWYDRMSDVRHWVEQEDASVVYAPNFSIGVAILARALEAVTPLLDQLPEYDAFIHEIHHVNKVDSPSGTAIMLGQLLVDGIGRKTRIDAETQHGRIDDEALHVTSTRAGGVIGQHTVSLDSPFDAITFEHHAKNRQGFAFGAVRAAEWLQNRKGLFTVEDMLEDLMKEAEKQRARDGQTAA